MKGVQLNKMKFDEILVIAVNAKFCFPKQFSFLITFVFEISGLHFTNLFCQKNHI